jgi:hypothetical protein
MKQKLKQGIVQGFGIFVGLFATAAFAYTVSGTIKTWTTGDTLTASDLNTTVQSLKTAVESATQIGVSYIWAGPTQYSGIPYSGTLTSEAGLQLSIPRDGVVKSIKVLPSSNTCTGVSTLVLRKNAVDSAVTFSIPASSIAAQTTATTLSFVAGDILTWKMTCASGSIFANVAYEF